MAMYKALNRYTPEDADRIAQRLLHLRRSLDEQITSGRRPNSLIVGSWNIREFDSGKGAKRLDETYHYLAEMIDRFDICAVQEVNDDMRPLERLVDTLGRQNWAYFVTDVTAGRPGNRERMALLYNTNKVFFRNLIGEIVLPKSDRLGGLQFARTPFFAAFQAGWYRFILCTCHIYYGADHGDKKQRRIEEIAAIGEECARRATAEDEVYILLGDMNIIDADDPTRKALSDEHFDVPTFPPTNLGGTRFYDQIAFTRGGNRTRLVRHGTLDWRQHCFLPEDKDFYHQHANLEPNDPAKPPRWENWDRYYPTWCTHQMSDHLPIWVELEIDYSDDYLRRFVRS